MEKIDRKKMAKATLLTASLAMGVMLGQSFFNEAQASGDSSYNLKAELRWNGSSPYYACPNSGNDCRNK